MKRPKLEWAQHLGPELLTKFAATEKPATTSHTVKFIPKQRVNSSPFHQMDGDLYSAKPLWQQLADVEGTWKRRFKPPKIHKGTSSEFSDVVQTKVDTGFLKKQPNLSEDALVNDISLKDGYYEEVTLPETLPTSADSLTKRDMLPSNSTAKVSDDIPSLHVEMENLQRAIMGDPNEIDAATPAAAIKAETQMEPETWLNMDPTALVLQQRILKSKTPLDLLQCVRDEIQNLNAVNAATALHRMAKFSSGGHKRTIITRDETLHVLVSSIVNHLSSFDAQGLCNVLWSLVRLELNPDYMPKLLDLIQRNVNVLGTTELASTLYCLSRLGTRDPVALELRDLLIGITQDKISQFNRPQDLVCISTALARLNVRNPSTFSKIAAMVLENMDNFTMQQICGITWSFASLRFANEELFRSIKACLECRGDQANVRDIVFITWALARVNAADGETLVYTISPIIRSNIRHLGAREIATVAWAFVNARVEDVDLMLDLAHALVPMVNSATTKDLTACISAFQGLDLPVWEALQKRAMELVAQFTPLQLAKITLSLPPTNPELFQRLAKTCMGKMHLFTPENILELIVGFTNANVVDDSLYKGLVQAASRGVQRLYAEDAVCFVDALTRLDLGVEADGLVKNTLAALLEHIEQRVARWRCLELAHVIQLFDAVNKIKTDASSLVSCIAKQLQAYINKNTDLDTFKNWLLSTSRLDTSLLQLIQTQVNIDTVLLAALHGNVSRCRVMSAELVAACIKIGFCDDVIIDYVDNLLNDPKGLTVAEKQILIPELADANLRMSWVKHELVALASCGHIDGSNEASVGLLWTAALFGDDDSFINIAKTICTNTLPRDIIRAKQAALHARFLGFESSHFSDWLAYQPRSKPKNLQKQAHACFYTASQALVSMQIAHKSWHVIEGMYTVAASFPLEMHVLDVFTASDLLAPKSHTRAQALLRQRQLQLLGFGVASVREDELDTPQQARDAVANAISGFNKRAHDLVNAKKS